MLYDTEGPYKRELLSASLIAHHLAKKNYSIRWCKIDDLFMIDALRPTAVLLPDTYNPENMIAARYARDRLVPVITYESEVTYYPGPFAECSVWGWNTAHEPLENLSLVAGSYTKELSVAQGKDPARVRIGGFHRMDVFKLQKFLDKKSLLEKYSKTQFKNCVGYAAWGFHNVVEEPQIHPLFEYYLGKDNAIIKVLQKQREKIQQWLQGVIESLPETLFILKAHPGGEIASTEIANLSHYPNVLLLHREEQAPDLISACDVWMAWNSTTLLEAFVCDKPVLFPKFDSETDAMTIPAHEGADIVSNAQETVALISRYVGGATISEAQQTKRKQIIAYTAVSSDGQNSARSASEIHRLLQTLTYSSNFKIDGLFLKSFIKTICRRLSTFMADALGVRNRIVMRFAGTHRFRQSTAIRYSHELSEKLRSMSV